MSDLEREMRRQDDEAARLIAQQQQQALAARVEVARQQAEVMRRYHSDYVRMQTMSLQAQEAALEALETLWSDIRASWKSSNKYALDLRFAALQKEAEAEAATERAERQADFEIACAQIEADAEKDIRSLADLAAAARAFPLEEIAREFRRHAAERITLEKRNLDLDLRVRVANLLRTKLARERLLE